MNEHPGNDDSEHTAMNELIPWYVNGTLDDSARRRLDQHLPTCPECRADMRLERAVHARIAAQPAVEYMPVASLKRLNATLDELQSVAAHRSEVPPAVPPAAATRALPAAPQRLLRRWRLAVAASIVLVAAGLGLVMVDRVTVDRMTGHGDSASGGYHTVTTARAKPPHEAGVYTLAPTSTLATASSLEILRRHAGVRFAESSSP